MAKRRDTIVRELWNAAIRNITVAQKAWSAVADQPDCPARDAVSAALGQAEAAIFDVPAPTLAGVAKKLEILAGENLMWGGSPASIGRKMIGDVLRIERQLAGIEEPELSGRSADQIEAQLAQWRGAVQDREIYASLLHQGPSEAWGELRQADLVSLIEDAASAIVSLPAATLHGVILKVELLWNSFGFSGGNESGAASILGDLRRFARNADGE